MSAFKIYRIVTTTTSTPFSFTSGTTATSSGPIGYDDKGVELTVQNQSTAATNIWIGGSDVVPSIGATSTLGVGGIMVAQNATFQIGKRHAPSAIQMTDYYVTSTSSNAIAVAFLLKGV